MLKLFDKCFGKQIIPSMLRKGVINPISKDCTKDPRQPTNYRGITLACVMYMVYCGVLNGRLVTWAEVNELLCDEQNGFRKNRRTVDYLSSLTSIIETRKLQKKDSFTAFVDFSKVYDRIDRSLLWEKLSGMGLSSKMLSAIKVLYRDVECCVRINGFKSPWFNVNTGLKQGCLLSPVLFNLFINDLVDEIKQSVKGVNIGDEWNVVFLYADDICILTENEADLQKTLNIVHDWCTRWNMTVNTDKTQIVHFRTQSKE